MTSVAVALNERGKTRCAMSGRPEPSMVSSDELLRGNQLLLIEHAGTRYVLRMTRNNKLILTK